MSVPDIHKIKRAFILGCIFFLVGTSLVFSQKVEFEPVYYNITTEHGLPSMETYSVKQDSKGYIWICTDAGVCRYDGFEFRTFTTKDGLTDNVVFDTYEDHKGRIWFTGIDTRLCYYENGSIKPYRYNHLLTPLLKEQMSPRKFLSIADDGTVYYSVIGCGLIVISPHGKLTRTYNGSGEARVFDVEEGKMFTYNKPDIEKDLSGLSRIGIIQTAKNTKLAVSNISQWGNKYFGELSNGKTFLMSSDCIDDLTTGRKVFQEDLLLYMTIINDVFWIGTLKGLIRAKYDETLKRVVVVDRFFIHSSVSTVLFDKSGNLWLGTLGKGIFFCGAMDVFKASKDQGLINNNVVDIERFKGVLLVSTLTGIQSADGGQLKDIEFIENYRSAKLCTNGKQLLVSSGSAVGQNNYLMMRISENIMATSWLSHSAVYNGTFYGSSIGIRCFDLVNDKSEIIVSTFHENTETYRGVSTCFTMDTSGAFYLGTNSGILKNEQGKWSEFGLGGGEPFKIRTLNYHPEIGLIVGTANNGLYIKNGKERKVFNELNGLLSSKVNAVAVLDNQLVLIGSSRGMNIYDPVRNMIYCFTQNDCMNVIDVNTFFIEGDDVYIGTENGLFKVTKEALLKRMSSTPMRAVSIKRVFFDEHLLSPTDEVLFPTNTNLLKIDFSVLQFDNWFSKKYQYRIGEKGQWVDIESPSISLYRPSGEFDIEIRYMDADFQWSSPVKLCHVEVLLPFWMRWYFWTLIGAGVMLLIFYLYQRRQERVNTRLLQENQMLLLEQQMQHARMNPHFVFNVLNSIHSFVIHEDKDQAELYLMKFSRLMRETLVQSREGSSKIAEECSILIKYLELEQLRSKGRFEFSIQADESVRKCFIPSMLVQPFVENAVLHGLKALESGQLKVTFSQQSEQVVKVCIWDSGQLTEEQFQRMQASGDRNAFGITKLRLEKYNKLLDTTDYGIEVKYGESGTDVCLYIPVLKEDDI